MASDRVRRQVGVLLNQVEEAASRLDWDRVRQLCDGVLRLDPQNQDAIAFLEASDRDSGVTQGPAAARQPARSPPPGAAQSAPKVPVSFASGRYVVKRFLGEGGKKEVYLAHDTTLDRDVAFALIKTDGLDDVGKERIRREAQAMGRMGTHPHVMPIYDLGEEHGQPFMVQPLMMGGDVAGLIEKAAAKRKGGAEDSVAGATDDQAVEAPGLPLERAVQIARHVCLGLQFAHGKGIVHRDLKPGNIWLDEDGTAKIGDFGLAIASDRSRLTFEKVMVGTVSYMPPEQAIGGKVTPRADLYSLGAMLYEMVTGRPPFLGDDDIAIIGQHINTPPVAPSWHNTALPQTLDALIMRLLSKDPAARPGSAREVIKVLDAIDLTQIRDASGLKSGSLDAMAGGVFVGRQREMDRLKALFEETMAGHGRMATLVGEPGIGKTRTAQELATYASMRGARVIWGRCYESGGAPPYWPWVQIVRSHVAATAPELLRSQLGAAGPVVAEVVPDIAQKLTDLPKPPPIEDPESARFRLFDSMATFFRNVASQTPLVLLLEDLHWADRPSLNLLEFVARELQNSRALMVGNYRDIGLNRRHPLSVTLGELTRERLFERVVLRGLQRHDVRRFIEVAAGIDPPPALVDVVYGQTEGNPLFVTETVRLLIQQGEISSGAKASGGTSSWEIRIPEGVREVIGRRLDRLSERCNDVLTVAAVIGRQFRSAVLIKLVEGISEDVLLDVLDEALDGRIIEEQDDEVGTYQFTHALMQETLASELSANRLVRLHARIAEALESHYGDAAEAHASELVEHFDEAETVLGSDRLAKYSRAAGERSLEAYGFDEAARHFKRGIGVASESQPADDLARMHAGLARAQAATLKRDEIQSAVDNLRRAFDLYAGQNNNTAAVTTALTYFPNIHGTRGMVDLLSKALDLATPGTREAGFLLTRRGMFLSFESFDPDAAIESIEGAHQIALDLEDPALELATVSASMIVNFLEWRYDQAIARLPRALELVERVDDLRMHFGVFDHVGQIYYLTGDLEEARSAFARNLRTAETLGDRTLTQWALGSLMDCANDRGDWALFEELAKHPAVAGSTEMRVAMPLLRAACQQGRREDAVRISGESGKRKLIGSQYAGADRFILLDVLGVDVDPSAVIAVQRSVIDNPRTHLGQRITALRREAMLFAHIGDVEAVRNRYEELQSIAHLATYDGLAVGDRALGYLAWKIGNLEAAAGHYEDALGFCRRGGFRVELAWALFQYAEVLAERNDVGDRKRVVSLQDEAIEIGQELGLSPLLERILARRRFLKA